MLTSAPPAQLGTPDRQILTVTQLNRAAKNLLDTYLPLMWVEGEISNFAAPSSGHWYFTLKDARAQVRCAMFKGRNQRVVTKPKAGDKVVLRAKASLYEGRGDYQLIAEHMEPAGFGDLQRQYEALKAQLQAEGLFDEDQKQALPKWPKKIGIVTSITGAAIHDILSVLKRRFPALEILILPVAVQGDAAAGQIAEAIASANSLQSCDILMITRGGGSIEDLWAFNEELVARAIFESRIPTVSAVGHEVDFTIADFAADMRAPTPSAGAELITANQEGVSQTLAQHLLTLEQSIKQTLQIAKQQLKHSRARLQHPGQILNNQSQAMDRLEIRMKLAIQTQLKHLKLSLESSVNRLEQASPAKTLTHKQQTLQSLKNRLIAALTQGLQQKKQRLNSTANLLHGVSPLNTLNRGYSILTTESGEAVRDASEVKPGDKLKAHLKEGFLECEVLESLPR